MRLHGAIAAAFVATLLAGCQTVGSYYNSLFGSSAPVEKPAELPNFTQTVPASVAWQARVSAATSYVFRPAVAGENVFVSGNAGDVASLDLRTGKSAWVAEAGAKISAGVGSDGRTVVVGTARGEVIALEGTGRLLWRAQVSSEVLSAPVVEEGIVVVRSADGQLHGLDARDGRRRWLYQRPLPPLIMRSPAGVTIDRGGVFAGFPGGKAVAISLPTGGLGWEATVSLPRGATELERIADIVGAPAVEGPHVCAASFQGRIACFDAQKGSTLWARDLSSLMPLAIDARYVFATDEKNAVHAFERGAGTSVWKQDKLAGRGLTGPQVYGRYVAVGDFQGYVHLLNRDDGSFAGRVPTDGSAVLSQPVATKAGLLVQTRNGGIFMIAVP